MIILKENLVTSLPTTGTSVGECACAQSYKDTKVQFLFPVQLMFLKEKITNPHTFKQGTALPSPIFGQSLCEKFGFSSRVMFIKWSIVFLVLRVIFKISWGWGELFCWFLFDWVLIDLLSKQVHGQKHNFVSDGDWHVKGKHGLFIPSRIILSWFQWCSKRFLHKYDILYLYSLK